MKQILDNADILLIAPFYLGYILASDQFCKKYLGASKKNELLFVLISYGCWLLWNIVDRLDPIPYIFSIAPDAVFFCTLVLLFRSDREKRILAASILMLILRLAVHFCDSFLSCLILSLRHTIQKIPEPFLNNWEIGLIGCVDCCLVILAVFWMSKHLESVFYGKQPKWYGLLAVPLLILITVFDIVGWGASNGIMVRSGGNMGLYYDQIFSHIEFLVLALLSMAATGFYVFGMNRIYLEQEKINRYHSQVAIYKMLAEQAGQSERLRHDMKNHIIALSGLFEGKEWEKMGGYLKQLEKSGLGAGGDMTGNKAVDALLYQKRKRAKQEEVRWECDIQLPKICCINEFDLCVLFGNILDNALEACGRLRPDECGFINIQAKTVKKCFLLEVKNSMDRTEKDTEKSARKGNPQKHGIGLMNVRDVVDKYDGAMHTETGDSTFVISILIPLDDAAHNIKQAV
ncbi:MAG: ATP-binding protein [Blautia sp.]|nr:ATP-binding protein [Blautia sp.]